MASPPPPGLKLRAPTFRHGHYLAIVVALLPLPAPAADETVVLEPISKASAAVVGTLLLGARSLEFVDGVRIQLEPVATDTGGDPELQLYRVATPIALAPVRPNTICAAGQPVTFVAIAYPPDVLDLPEWQRDEYRLAFYGGQQAPAIADLRQTAAGDGLCLWGAWAEVQR